MTLTQQWRYLNLTRLRFYILFPEKSTVSYMQITSSPRWRALLSTGE